MMPPTTTIPWWIPDVGGEERSAVASVVDSNYLNEGEVTVPSAPGGGQRLSMAD